MPWARLQSGSVSTGTGTTGVKAFTTALTAGSTLIAACAAFSGVTTGVRDTAGNSFVKIASVGFSAVTANGETSLWALNTPAGDAGAVTTVTATAASGVSGVGLLIQEVSGLALGATLAALADGTPGVLGSSGTGSKGPPVYASTAAGEYLVSVYGDNGSGTTFTVPAGYTADTANLSGSANDDIGIAYKNSTAGTEAGSWTLAGSSSTWGMLLVAFQLASSAAPRKAQDLRLRTAVLAGGSSRAGGAFTR